MALVSLVQSAFKNIAAHITNLSQVRDIIDDVLSSCSDIDNALQRLEVKRDDAEITLRTDIQILINEILSLRRKWPV